MVFPWEPSKAWICDVDMESKGLHMPLRECAYRKKGIVILCHPRISFSSIRDWREKYQELL